MSKMDIYYEALAAYRKYTRENSDCVRQRKYISRANADEDRIEVIKNECTIDDDWIVEIEKGLDFIDKAIKEERQFILSNGEIVPIEKVKSVSKESVEHLAKHSNLVTRLPKGNEDLTPDQLYTVERETDFAVYENRFLYMLLCYLRDFIALRYNSIVDAVTTYEGKLKVKKNIIAGDRKTQVEFMLDETLKNDEYLREHNSAKEKIDRIDGLFKAVIAFLSHPLMEHVAKAPMLKPPITETNVLKMNKNFKGAVQLYYFVTAYTKKGYEINTKTQILNPFKEHVADDIAEMIELSSFLTYEHGMGVEGDLKQVYDENVKKQKEEEEKKFLEKIQALRRRVRDNGENPEEYMLMLEQRNRALEADSAALVRAKLEIKSLNDRLASAKSELERVQTELNKTNDELERCAEQLRRIDAVHAEEMHVLRSTHENEVERINAEHTHAVYLINNQHQANIDALNAEHQANINRVDAEHRTERDMLQQSYERSMDMLAAAYDEKLQKDRATYNEYVNSLNSDYRIKIDELEDVLFQSKSDAHAAMQKAEAIEHKQAITAAKLNVLKSKSGMYEGNENYNSEDGFNELEREYNEFKTFYKDQWRKTKRQIREQYLKNRKNTKTVSKEQAPVIAPEKKNESANDQVQ